MTQVVLIGLDVAKNVFQLHAVAQTDVLFPADRSGGLS